MYLLRHSHTQVKTYAGMCSLRYLLCTHAFSPGHEVAAAGTCCTSSTRSSESLIRAHPHSLETCCATQTQHSRNLCCIIKAWKWNILRWRDAWQVARPANCRKDLRLFAILENRKSQFVFNWDLSKVSQSAFVWQPHGRLAALNAPASNIF